MLASCERGPSRQTIAVIASGGNPASIALHEALGFHHADTLRAVRWKPGQWLDTTLMQRPLGDGDRTSPAPPAAH